MEKVSISDVLVLCREKEVKAVDLRFTDLFGSWRHTTIPMNHFSADSFEEGFGFDGSSVRGWQSIHESDMLMSRWLRLPSWILLPTFRH